MSAEDNAALVRRFVEEVFNRGNLDVVDQLVTPDYVHHDPTTEEFGSGREGFKRLIRFYREAFPDLAIELEDQIATAEKVVDRWTGRGTHRGELMGMAPTGREVRAGGMSIHRISGGRIAETWNNYDALGMLGQLGAVRGPGG